MFGESLRTRQRVHREIARTLGRLRDERGFTESSLVLIPTIILFLCLIQICASVLSRSAELNQVQGNAGRSSLFKDSLELRPAEANLSDQRTTTTRKPLPGGGAIIIKRSTTRSPSLTPLLPLGDQFETIGISVDEND